MENELQRSQAEVLQAALQHFQIYTDALSKKFLIDRSQLRDFLAAVQLLQNPDAPDYSDSFGYGQPSALPFVHQGQVSRQFFRQKTALTSPAPRPVLVASNLVRPSTS